MATAVARDAMLTKLVFGQVVEQLTKGIVANGAKSARGELHLSFFEIDEPCFFKHLGHFSKPLHGLCGVFSEHFADLVDVDFCQLSRVGGLAKHAFHFV
ncbi:MAG: hypothetical protein EBW68_05690 [Actinobacteria bacterium]|nr:hypothetical protein [Actinomycetota bacterium]